MFYSGSIFFSHLLNAILLLTNVNLTMSADYDEGPPGPDTYNAYYGLDYDSYLVPYDCNEEVCSVVSEDMSLVSELYTTAVIAQNEDKPYECRTDICYESETYDSRKGTITWPESVIGQKVYIPCPFAFDELLHASRNCMYDEEGTTDWLEKVDLVECPDPPLHELLKILYQERWSIQNLTEASPSSYISRIESTLIKYKHTPIFTEDITDWSIQNLTEASPSSYISRIESTLIKYKHTPIFTEDITDVFSFIVHSLDLFDMNIEPFTLEVLEQIANILDVFVDEENGLRYTYKSAVSGTTMLQIFDFLQKLPTLIDIDHNYRYKLNTIEIQIFDVPVFNWEETVVDLNTGFDYSFDFNQSTVSSPGMSLTIQNSASPIRIAVVLMKHGYLYGQMAEFYLHSFTELYPCEPPVTEWVKVTLPPPQVYPMWGVSTPEAITPPADLEAQFATMTVTVPIDTQEINTILHNSSSNNNALNTTSAWTMDADLNEVFNDSSPIENTSIPNFRQDDKVQVTKSNMSSGILNMTTVDPDNVNTTTLTSDYPLIALETYDSWYEYELIQPTIEFCERKIFFPFQATMIGSLVLVASNLTGNLDDLIQVNTMNVPCPRSDTDPLDLMDSGLPICQTADKYCASSNGPLAETDGDMSDNLYSKWWASDQWSPKTGGCRSQLLDGHRLQCDCAGTGMFSVFIQRSDPSIIQPPPIYPPKPMKPTKTSLAGFVGFKHRKSLDILGDVLAGVSLFCLILTVLSPTVFRNTRKGKPSKILVNLCISLICLIVMNYIAKAITQSINSCMAANLMRYYFVFVSLLWNGVEAINMYLMIVKVFNSDIRKFVRKAAVVAWGVPLLMIGVGLAIDKKSFHGQYYITSNKTLPGECSYTCQLRTSTLYYGYLIPLGGIFINNVFIFSMVMRALIKAGENRVQANDKRNKIIKLVQAVATLVLLGTPWIFSVFGVIDTVEDPQLKDLETICHVLFVLVVNLQGVFIFLFHCLRNGQVRREWVHTFTEFTSSVEHRFTQSSHTSKTDSTLGNPESGIASHHGKNGHHDHFMQHDDNRKKLDEEGHSKEIGSADMGKAITDRDIQIEIQNGELDAYCEIKIEESDKQAGSLKPVVAINGQVLKVAMKVNKKSGIEDALNKEDTEGFYGQAVGDRSPLPVRSVPNQPDKGIIDYGNGLT